MTPLALQLLVPLLLLGWLAVRPPASRLVFVTLAIAAGASLLASATCGLWTLLPWWTPHLLAIVLLVTVAWRWRGRRQPPAPAGERTALVLAGVVTAGSLLVVAMALGGRQAPSGPLAEMASPFREGTWLVVNGGGNGLINAHRKTAASDDPRFRHWRGQSHAVDLVRIDAAGLRAKGLRPADPADYLGFGTPVVAPCGGTIVRVQDDVADNPVPRTNRDAMAGNHVIVRCGEFDVVLAHLRRGSVAVRHGDLVTVGQHLGDLGNSGNSDEPHLHVHAQRASPESDAGETFASAAVPLRIAGRYLARNDRFVAGADRR